MYKTSANLTVIYNGDHDYFKGLAEISIHGASSVDYPQKSISLETKHFDGKISKKIIIDK